MRDTLDDDALTSALATLSHWQLRDGALVREVTADSFAGGIRLVDAVAVAADEANHHPDIDIRWTTVTFRLVTHSAGGITEQDVSMAARIDDLVGQSLSR